MLGTWRAPRLKPMSTRKLILWSLVCGVLILVAGGIKLRQSVETTSVDEKVHAVGETVAVGGMNVTVESLLVTSDKDRKSTRLNSSHEWISRMPSSA